MNLIRVHKWLSLVQQGSISVILAWWVKGGSIAKLLAIMLLSSDKKFRVFLTCECQI